MEDRNPKTMLAIPDDGNGGKIRRKCLGKVSGPFLIIFYSPFYDMSHVTDVSHVTHEADVMSLMRDVE